MNVSRRAFLGGAASFGAFWGARAFAAPPGLFSDGEPLLSFAAISDIHVCHPRSSVRIGTKLFEHALEWYRGKGVDAVLVAGDLANYGLSDELEMVGAAWRRVFPGNRGEGGRTVEKVFVTGNHDHDAWNYGSVAHDLYPVPKDLETHKLVNGYPKHWQAAFDEPYAPIYMKEIAGYRFIGSHWDDGDIRQFGPRLKAFLAAHRDELKGDKPFFYVQHPHPRGTLFGDLSAGSADDGTVKEALAEFPNAIVFSGHSHWAITDERSIWQGEFTSVNLGCLWRTGFCRTKNGIGGYENWRTPGMRKKTPESIGRDEAKAMGHYAPAFLCHHGSLVKVYADRVVIERREFTHDLPVADDWVIPLPAAAERPFAYATREAKAVAPEFPAGARLTVEAVRAKNRAKAKKDAIRLAFPAALAVKGVKPFDYLIEIRTEKGERLVRSVLAQGVELGADSESAKGPSTCVLARETLPEGRLAFKVFPGESFGRLGRPLEGTL